MLSKPDDMTCKSINLCAKGTIELNVFNLLQNTGADVAVNGVLRMPIMIKFDGRLFFLGDHFLWLVRDLMEVIEF